MEEKAILFQAVVPVGERRLMVNAWFKVHPTHKISGPFHASQPPSRLGISSTFVGSYLYTIGGRVPNHFVLSDYIRCLSTDDTFSKWLTFKLPSPCVDSVLGVYGKFLYILPGVWKYGYYHMDENTYLTTRKGYIWDTSANDEKDRYRIIEPPAGRWQKIHACAALDKKGLLIAMDGEKNFFLSNPEKDGWEIYDFGNPLPKFIGETSFVACNSRLYILEARDEPPAFLYIYDIKEMKLVMDKKPLEFDDDLWSVDKWDRVGRLVLVTDEELCFLWLGPVSYENEDGWPPVRTLHYLKFKVSILSDQPVEVVDNKVFYTNITNLLDCLPCDPDLFGTRALEDEDELPARTTAARENSILIQAVVPSVEKGLKMNAWFKIQPTLQMFGPFHGRQPFRSRISSTFVGSYLYTIDGEVSSSRLRKSGYISWLDTRSPFNGWEVGELPSSCVDPIICVSGDFLYILTKQESYIWNTRVNECLEARILPPKVEGGDQKQWPKIRGCAASEGRRLLIVVDGEENFFLYKPENNDWEPCNFKDPFPEFDGNTSFAASNGKLYILEFPVISQDFLEESQSGNLLGYLYIYNIKEGKLVINKKPILVCDYPWLTKSLMVIRMVPMADDKLCFLWLADGNVQYLKLKFSFSPNASKSEYNFQYTIEAFEEFDMEGDLLECLPCEPEQFPAEVVGKSPLDHLLDAFQKQQEDSDSQKEKGKSLISGEPFQDQAEDIASPEEEERKSEMPLVPDPKLSRECEETRSFQKVLRQVDVKNQLAVESSFMRYLPDSSGGGTINLKVLDVASGKMYAFAYYTRSRGHKKPFFRGEWHDYCGHMGLKAGDRITFSANRGSYTIVAERKIILCGREVWERI